MARGLLQVAQDMRATRAVRLKAFVRPDMLEDKTIVGFPDASKLLARRANLSWRKVDLYALFYQCVGNATQGGALFRDITATTLSLEWQRADSLWLIPKELCGSEELQERNCFKRWRAKRCRLRRLGLKRGKLISGPSTTCRMAGIRSAREASAKPCAKRQSWQSLSDFEGHQLPLHFKSIQAGVQAASQVRVDELVLEDYPWVTMSCRRCEVSLRCPAFRRTSTRYGSGMACWKLGDELNDVCNFVKLPPQHLAEGLDGVLLDLVELGLIQRLSDGRIQMPDVYRIAFGLGRRGGVKPLK